MYANNNKQVVVELARENLRSHRTRNIMAILAIFLTTVLIAAVFTAGFSLIYTGQNASEQTPGPASDGYFTGGRENYERIQAHEAVEWADFVQKGSRLALHNDIFSGVETRLYAPDDNFYRDNLVELKAGAYPAGPEEILISDTLAERLGEAGQVGQPFTLRVMLGARGEEVEEAVPMTICGIYHNPLEVIANVYDEIYVSPEFIPVYNPLADPQDQIIYVQLGDLNPLKMKTDVRDSLARIAQATDTPIYSPGKNSGLLSSTLAAMAPVFVFVLLLMASGYFLIYNVFYISIVSDIQWFGLMKTIGATGRQLKAILRRQVRLLAAVGILAGGAAGYLVGLVIAPKVLAMTNWALYYKAPSFVWVMLFAAVFAGLTVKISSSRPLKLASSISPIEAQRFTPKRRKNAFTILSLALSGIIFLAASNVAIGYQPEVFVDRFNQEDFQITQKGTIWAQEEMYDPIPPQLADDLEALDFVERVDKVYIARTHHTPDQWNYYPVSMGEVKAEGPLWTYFQKLRGLDIGDPSSAVWGAPVVNERGNLAISIAGVPPHRLSTEAVNFQVLEGSLDAERFAQGDGLIYNMRGSFNNVAELADEEELHVGDVLPITFYDDAADRYVTKELTVLAIIKAAHEYSSSDIKEAELILPDTLFREIYSGADEMIGALEIKALHELKAEEIGTIREVMMATHNFQLMTDSRYNSRIEGLKNQETYAVIGFFLAGILAVIGLSNVVNTVTANVLSRKLEYAAMQSVGMTKRQLGRLLMMDSAKYCGLALVIMLPVGGYLAKLLAENSLFTGFNTVLFVQSALAVTVILLAVCLVLAAILVWVLNRRSIVERLREIA